MNVQEYISSGIVESYVLGLASPEEQQEFESMCQQYPEVLAARNNFEIALEEQAMQNAVVPPVSFKQQVTAAVIGTAGTAKVIPVTSAPVVKTNWFKYAAAAAVILLAGSLYWNISLYNKNNQLKNDYTNSIAKLDDIQKQIDMIVQNPNVKMAAMKGMEKSPASFATVYWDSTSKDVYLVVNNLPEPPTGMQYQLWALLDGKPVDVGMIDNDWFLKQNKLVLKMKNTSGAQAFAITLEKKGGNPTPKGDMYTMGNL